MGAGLGTPRSAMRAFLGFFFFELCNYEIGLVHVEFFLFAF